MKDVIKQYEEFFKCDDAENGFKVDEKDKYRVMVLNNETRPCRFKMQDLQRQADGTDLPFNVAPTRKEPKLCGVHVQLGEEIWKKTRSVRAGADTSPTSVPSTTMESSLLMTSTRQWKKNEVRCELPFSSLDLFVDLMVLRLQLMKTSCDFSEKVKR